LKMIIGAGCNFHRDQSQGDIKVHQLRDNRSRHQFEERVVTILSWIQAAMRGIGHICTTCILETQTYVLIMRSLHSGVLASKRRKET
jgi:hypothetical protein